MAPTSSYSIKVVKYVCLPGVLRVVKLITATTGLFFFLDQKASNIKANDNWR